MPAVALSRAGARVVGTWQRLEALPDPRSPQGRIYPLACLVAIAVCAFTAAGNDRFTAVGQWIRRASQADLARLRAPWDPIAGRYRAPDEKRPGWCWTASTRARRRSGQPRVAHCGPGAGAGPPSLRSR